MVEILGQIDGIDANETFPQCNQLLIEAVPESIWDQKYQDVEIKESYKVVYR